MTDSGPVALPLAVDFEGCSGPLSLPADGEVLSALLRCLAGWPHQILPLAAEGGDFPVSLSVPLGRAIAGAFAAEDRIGRHKVASRYTDRPTGALTPTGAVCSLIADLSQDWADTGPDLIGLHAGAVEIGGGLVIFAGPARAGKSTLVSHLSLREGVRFYCDDVLPVRLPPRDGSGGQASGIALGIAPRLRLPLPEGSGDLQRALAERPLLADHRYGYFAPPSRARYGATAPLRALIVLERRDDMPAGLYHLGQEEAMSALLRQAISAFSDADAAFVQLSSLLSSLPRARLVYSGLDEGADLVLKGCRLADGLADLPPLAVSPPETSLEAGDDAPPEVEPAQIFHRTPEVILRRIGAKAWLSLPEDGMLWEMNEISLAVWGMLEEPGSVQEMAAILAEFYPQIGEARLLRDVSALFADLWDAGLIGAE